MTRIAVVFATVLLASCAPAPVRLPSGTPRSATDGRVALDDATGPCRNARTFTAEIGASGSVGRQRLRGKLLVGLAAPASARIEAIGPSGPIFIYVASGDTATLLMPSENRVLERGKPAEVLEAVAGVPLDGLGLRAALTACALSAEPARARMLGDDWRVVPDGANEVYLKRIRKPDEWRVMATVFGRDEWRASYADFDLGLPRTVRLAGGDRFNLTLKLTQVALNEPLGPDVFRVVVPPDATRITIEELRRSGPFGSAPAAHDP